MFTTAPKLAENERERARMKRNQKRQPTPRDTPATRKKRLQERLQEISTKSEQELVALMKSIDKLKSGLKNTDEPDKKD